jgi:hypothetical protein
MYRCNMIFFFNLLELAAAITTRVLYTAAAEAKDGLLKIAAIKKHQRWLLLLKRPFLRHASQSATAAFDL